MTTPCHSMAARVPDCPLCRDSGRVWRYDADDPADGRWEECPACTGLDEQDDDDDEEEEEA